MYGSPHNVSEPVTRKNPEIPYSERRYLTVPYAGSYMSLGASSIYKLISLGKIETIKVGNRRLVVRESLDNLAS
jgi:excisionase family DNA binding protein